jgi:hypothetical protein
MAAEPGDDSELRLLLRGSIDGLVLSDELADAADVKQRLEALLGESSEDALPVVQAWLKVARAWCVGLKGRSDPSAAWSNETQSYALSLATAGRGELTFSEYRGGRLI